MKTNNKGFTLIELLVVIAIIGILSGLIVVSMSGAQGAAKNARIKSEMNQLRSVAAIYLATTGANANYGTVSVNGATAGTNFATATEGALLVADMLTQAPTAATLWGPTTTLTTFCVRKALNTGAWCIDSTGYSGTPSASGCTTTAASCLLP